MIARAMQDATARRARFQIHLSTAIVLMFVAGGLIWANVYGRRDIIRGTGWRWGVAAEMTESEFFASNRNFWEGERFIEYGWPFHSAKSHARIFIQRNGEMIIPSKQIFSELRTWPIIYNALVALAILFGVWFLCEQLIRRRAARQQSLQ